MPSGRPVFDVWLKACLKTRVHYTNKKKMFTANMHNTQPYILVLQFSFKISLLLWIKLK